MGTDRAKINTEGISDLEAVAVFEVIDEESVGYLAELIKQDIQELKRATGMAFVEGLRKYKANVFEPAIGRNIDQDMLFNFVYEALNQKVKDMMRNPEEYSKYMANSLAMQLQEIGQSDPTAEPY